MEDTGIHNFVILAMASSFKDLLQKQLELS